MKRILAAVGLSCAFFWGSTAYAACISEVHCDDGGKCALVETCDDSVDMTQASPDTITPIPLENDPLAESPVAAAVADASCREVDICGTTQLVCD